MFDEQSLSKITKEREKWEKTTVPSWLRRNPERKDEFKTTSGINIKRLYTPEDVKNLDYLKDLGFTGHFPFTRGLHTTMYSGRLWTMKQISGFGTAEQTNKRFRYLLKEGETGLSVAFDYPTKMVEAIKEKVAEAIIDDLKQKGELDKLVQKILAKETDPYSAADMLLAKRLKRFKTG